MSSSEDIGSPIKGIWQKYVGWLLIAFLFGYLANNFLDIYLGFNTHNLEALLTFGSIWGITIFSIYVYRPLEYK